MDKSNNDKVIHLMRKHSRLLSLRAPYDAVAKDVSTHFLPLRYRNVAESPSAYKGENILNPSLVDSTGVRAMRTLASGLQGGMTSPARPWVSLSIDHDDLVGYGPIEKWVDEVQDIFIKEFSESNFYNATYKIYGDLGTFGTGFVLELYDDEEEVLNFVPFSFGEYCLDVNHKQKVDTCFRRFQMSARQLEQRFGRDNLPEYVVSHLESNRDNHTTEERFTVTHAIYPRDKKEIRGEFRKRIGKHMPIASVYYLDSITGYGSANSRMSGGMKGHLLHESGFEEFPGFGIRWDVIANDVYGRSPAMDALPDCRMLQQQGITYIKALHKLVDPPLAVSASLKAVGIDLTPGASNFIETQAGQSPQAASPILQTHMALAEAYQNISETRNQIKEGLYNDLFRMLLDSNRRQITATEVDAKDAEKLVLLGPVLERLNFEFFNPLIERTFSLLLQHNKLPPLPEIPADVMESLAQKGISDIRQIIKVKFVSLLAQAQRAVAIGGIDRLVAFLNVLAQVDPNTLDAVDFDKLIDEYTDSLGTPQKVLRTQDERDALRKARHQAQAEAQAQAMQMQQGQMAMQGVQGAADAAYKLSQSNVDDNSALSAILGSGAGGVI